MLNMISVIFGACLHVLHTLTCSNTHFITSIVKTDQLV